MSEKEDWKTRFIAKLLPLKMDEDRATLAELRRGLGKDVTYVLAPVGWLFAGVQDSALDDAGLVATLFALHPEPGGEGSLGAAFRQLHDRTDSESVEKRFVALLDSDREDLPDRLRQAVALLKSNDVPINWLLLLTHVCNWKSEFRSVQRRWSRDFWTQAKSEEPPVASAPKPITEKGPHA